MSEGFTIVKEDRNGRLVPVVVYAKRDFAERDDDWDDRESADYSEEVGK